MLQLVQHVRTLLLAGNEKEPADMNAAAPYVGCANAYADGTQASVACIGCGLRVAPSL